MLISKWKIVGRDLLLSIGNWLDRWSLLFANCCDLMWSLEGGIIVRSSHWCAGGGEGKLSVYDLKWVVFKIRNSACNFSLIVMLMIKQNRPSKLFHTFEPHCLCDVLRFIIHHLFPDRLWAASLGLRANYCLILIKPHITWKCNCFLWLHGIIISCTWILAFEGRVLMLWCINYLW